VIAKIKNEINLVFTAMIFFTRIPSPIRLDYSEDILNRSSRYYSLIGVVIGTIAALVFYGSSQIFTKEISLLLSMISTILATGSFHEDGLADSCDALGGGYEKERILEIMKDSRIGTFGSVALISILLLKFYSLGAIPSYSLIITLLLGHSMSRSVSATFIYTSRYVSSSKSKSKPLAHKMFFSDLFVNLLVSYSLLFLLFPKQYLLWGTLTFAFLLLSLLIRYYTHKKIGGYTGDILGGIQQIMEVTIYLIIGVLL